MTFLKKQVKAGVKKELAALQKKRKSNDSDKEGECDLADVLNSKLEGFNCKDMENMSLDDIDKVSV